MVFLEALKNNILCLDGAMGSQMQAHVQNDGTPPDFLNLTHPETVTSLHQAYVDAGADVILTNTFNTNPFKKGMTEEKISEIIPKAVANARASGASYVLYDTTTLGKLIGLDISFEEAYRGYLSVFEKLDRTSVDGLFIETMADLNEAKVAVLAAKACHPELPVIVSMTYDSAQKTLTGSDPAACAAVLSGLGVQGIGVNCSTGPMQMEAVVESYRRVTGLPIFVKPNAGLPRLVEGKNVYDVTPRVFADQMAKLLNLNVAAVGGCCGTTPEHIRQLKTLLNRTTSGYSVIVSDISDTYGTHFTATRLNKGELLSVASVELPVSEKDLSVPGYFQRSVNKIIRQSCPDAKAVYFDLDHVDGSVLKKLVELFNLQPVTLKKPMVLKCSDVKILEGFLRYVGGKPVIIINSKQKNIESLKRLQDQYSALWLIEDSVKIQ